MRIVILTSWPLDVRLGSGVVRMVLGLQAGLRRLGHTTDILHPHFETLSFLQTANKRLQFNRYLGKFDFADYDVIIGSDFDGYALNAKYNSRFYVFNGATLKDILPFEKGKTARILRHLACRERQSMEKAQNIFVPSHYTARVVQSGYGQPEEKVVVAPLGIDYAGWRQRLNASRIFAKRGPEILCVAKQYPRKGIGDLLQAVALVRLKIKDVWLTIVGDGPQLRQNIALAERLGIKGTVTFAGDVADRHQLAAYFKRADIFCLPSYHETFGLVFLEAMAAGLPVVAYRAAAVPETVGTTGALLVAAGNIPELAQQLTRVLMNGDLASRLSVQAKQRAKKMDWLISAKKIIETNRLSERLR